MKRCKCGNTRFYARQVCRLDVIVDGYCNFVNNISKPAEASIYDSGNPYGPFICTKCGEEYDELTELPELRYRCYEEGYVGEYTEEELVDLYKRVVDKNDYPDYESWYADMIKLSIFVII